MKVSIVMAYHNRWKQLVTTLESINMSMRDVEIIIVDDASDEENSIENYVDPYLNTKVIRINHEEKTWHNPCIPFNRGFKEATGDVIIIQNPECLHVGDVVDYVVENIQENKYITFACYSADEEKTERISNLVSLLPNGINGILEPFNNAHPEADTKNGWYNHSEYNPCALHFCSAIMKKDLERLGGFDEQYAGGFAYEDMAFIRKIREWGFKVEICDNPYVVHQAHEPSNYVKNHDLFMRNQKLYSTGICQ